MLTFFIHLQYIMNKQCGSRSRWPCGVRRRVAAAGLLESPVRILLTASLFVFGLCFVLVSSDLCDELITRSEESCRLYVCVFVQLRVI